MRVGHALILLSTCFSLTTSCSDPQRLDRYDPELNLEREDYLGMTDANQRVGAVPPIPEIVPPIAGVKIEPPQIALQAGNVVTPPIPDLAEIIAAPKPPKIGTTKVVSIAVTDDVPLKDVLIELSKLADVDMEIDSSIAGGITFRAKDRPFNEVIDRIANMAGLRYTMKNNVLRIERDVPYVQTYALDMLNIDRASKGDIGVSSTGAASGGESSGGSSSGSSSSGGGTGGGSSSSITAESKSDFWVKFEDGVKKIIAFQPISINSGAVQPVLSAGGEGAAAVPGSFYALNRQAGTLTFSGTAAQHAIMQQFIQSIESNIASQVLIEAKIVEVSLNDSYQTGINWTKLGGDSLFFTGDLSGVSSADAALSAGTITLLKNDILRTGVDLSAAVSLLSEFGTTRALSSPRLNAMNNQQAVLSFVENIVYFQVDVNVTAAVAATATSAAIPAIIEVQTEEKKAPVGIQLVMQPTINQNANEITLSVRPTLSKVTKFVNDPGFEIGKAVAAGNLDPASPVIATLNAVTSKIPQLEVRELDSILKVKSGQVMIIGGLLEDTVSNNDTGIPGAAEIPYFGNLFKSVDKSNVKKELVILIRATIVPSSGSVQQGDVNLYNKFTNDPRPLNF